jgi:signal transduction histidine kinase
MVSNGLTGGGEMGDRIRAFDWSTTPIGSLENFPQSLRSILSLMLPSKASMSIFWGTDLIQFYNDAYVPLIGAKHPIFLGQPAHEGWREKWIVLKPLFDRVMQAGEGLQQVMWNLLSNAVKFTPASGRIEVRFTQVDDFAQIQVIDTGKGIAADFIPYVFEHFRQEHTATTRTFGGLGIGLAIVRQLVELHGGTIAVESAGENQGTTFTVRLPLLKQAIAAGFQAHLSKPIPANTIAEVTRLYRQEEA